MKFGKKLLSLLVAGALSWAFIGCGSTENVAEKESDKWNVVCVSFPEYDWARQVIGEANENVELTLIVDNGMDIHNYQPSTEDMVEISNSDLCIYNGGQSESWVVEAAANGKDTKTMNIMELLEENVVEEEIVEGMESEEAHAHDEEEEATHEEETHAHSEEEEVEETEEHTEETEYDEHIWLSLKNAIKAVEGIQAEVSALDKENAVVYQENGAAYIQELQALDKEYEAMVESGKSKVLLFGDRFPFRYLTEDYGLTYYAAFPGCSAETEASFETIVFLAEKVKENELSCILTIDGSDKAIAESVKNSVGDDNMKILTLNSLQSVSKEKLQDTTYLSVMKENLQVMKEALN